MTLPMSVANLMGTVERLRHCRLELDNAIAESTARVIVIDDDPTGTQPVRGVPVITRWDVDDLVWALGQKSRVLFVSTNTRSMPVKQAMSVVGEVVTNSLEAALVTGNEVSFVSRGDSTLRGHVWDEISAVAEAAESRGNDVRGIVFAPSFPEAGRITLGGQHAVVAPDGRPIPLVDTDYARDPTFGYASSDLRAFIEEKSRGAVDARSVPLLDLDTLRSGTLHDVATTLAKLVGHGGSRAVVAVDTVDVADVYRLAGALTILQTSGTELLVRAGPSLPAALAGGSHRPAEITEPAVLQRHARETDCGGGLVVVGSHVELSSRQLSRLLRDSPRPLIEFDVAKLLADSTGEVYTVAVVEELYTALRRGPAVLASSRIAVTGPSGDASLDIAGRVAAGLTCVVRSLLSRTDVEYLVAKGGITSSTLFSNALGASRAMVLGSVLPELVSAWIPEDGLRPELPYVVFAGNVGEDDSLLNVVSKLESQLRAGHPPA